MRRVKYGAIVFLLMAGVPNIAYADSGLDIDVDGTVGIGYHDSGSVHSGGSGSQGPGHSSGGSGHSSGGSKYHGPRHRRVRVDPHRDWKVPPGFHDSLMVSPTSHYFWPGSGSAPRAAKRGASPTKKTVRRESPSPEQIRTWSIDLATRIHLGDPVIDVQPKPSDNKWGIVAVGEPLWFHNGSVSEISSSQSGHGITVALNAKRVETVYETGESTVRCSRTMPRPSNADPRATSPVCGYVYQHPGSYTLTMREVWQVTWRSGDQTGVVTTTRSSSQPMEVKELLSVLTRSDG